MDVTSELPTENLIPDSVIHGADSKGKSEPSQEPSETELDDLIDSVANGGKFPDNLNPYNKGEKRDKQRNQAEDLTKRLDFGEDIEDETTVPENSPSSDKDKNLMNMHKSKKQRSKELKQRDLERIALGEEIPVDHDGNPILDQKQDDDDEEGNEIGEDVTTKEDIEEREQEGQEEQEIGTAEDFAVQFSQDEIKELLNDENINIAHVTPNHIKKMLKKSTNNDNIVDADDKYILDSLKKNDLKDKEVVQFLANLMKGNARAIEEVYDFYGSRFLELAKERGDLPDDEEDLSDEGNDDLESFNEKKPKKRKVNKRAAGPLQKAQYDNYLPDPVESNFKKVTNDIAKNINGTEVMKAIESFDDNSKKYIVENPNILYALVADQEKGIFKDLYSRILLEERIDDVSKPFLARYRDLRNESAKNKEKAQNIEHAKNLKEKFSNAPRQSKLAKRIKAGYIQTTDGKSLKVNSKQLKDIMSFRESMLS